MNFFSYSTIHKKKEARFTIRYRLIRFFSSSQLNLETAKIVYLNKKISIASFISIKIRYQEF